jgi:hypothetical protein
MNIMAFDVWRAFNVNMQGFQSPSGAHSRRFLYYSAYAWITPAIIIIIALSLDFTNSSVKPGYALPFCWFSNRKALIVFFALPLAIILVADSIFFSLTIYAIREASESAKMVAKQEKSRLSIYIKLASIMGLTWVFGFVASMTQVSPLWYMYIIFNTCQGLFICITFCGTKKVIKLLHEKVDEIRNGPQMSITF